MRCLSCRKFSLKTICTTCQSHLLYSQLKVRVVEDNFKIYSFFDYSEISHLLYAKHHFYGSFVYKALANLSFKHFAKIFRFYSKINVLPIDDRTKSLYSHTAILANAMRSDEIVPIFSALHSTSNVSYSGKDLIFRLKHPRNFKILKQPKFPVILVDDIVTTGTTIIEAKRTLQKSGCEVLFALTLADAKY